MAEPAIETSGLSKQYRAGWLRAARPALHPLDLLVRRGECLAVLGHNGAGKTTLVHLLAGLLRPTTGAALLLGRPVDDPEGRRGLGFLPERPSMPPRLRANDLLALCGDLAGLSRATVRQRAGDLLERLGIATYADRRIGELSAGTRQRLGLAQALLHRPEVLLLDEPLTGLDPASRRLVLHELRDARSAGTTMLVSTHHLSDWSALCDEVAVMHRGRMRILGPTAGVLASLPVRVQFTLTGPGPELPGSPLAAPPGLFARLATPEQRDGLVRGILSANGQVLRVEPLTDRLLEDEP